MASKLIEQLASKAPAAAMFRCIFERVLSEEALNKIFQDHAKIQVECEILFSHLVDMVGSVVTQGAKSLNAAHRAAGHEYSRQGLYLKLKGVETDVSSALLRVSTEKLTEIRKATKMTHLDVIKGFHTYVIDGKTYNATEHRLVESRTDARAPLPGRAIAMLDMRNEMFVDVQCDVNALRCERKVAEPLLERHVQPGALYIADRNFSDGNILEIFFRKKAYFIVRQHGACPSWREIPGKTRRKIGTDETGGEVYEQEIEVRLADKTWVTVRRITVELSKPTRNNETVIHLLTNLPKRIKALAIGAAYRKRWTIETCFGYLSRAFNAEIKSLCYPKAAGFCFSLSLLLFNMMSLIRSMLLAHGKYSERYEITDVSYYYIADEISRSQFAVSELIQRSSWKEFAKMTVREFAMTLKRYASQADLARYRKNPRGPKKPRLKRKFNGSRQVETSKLLASRK